MKGATLITNDYAFRHPDATDAVRSSAWDMTAGSLFMLPDGRYWTGIPDSIGSDAKSIKSTNSAVFRMVSKRNNYQDVAIRITFNLSRFTHTSKTPAVAWDGIHLMLRYRSQYELYYASINRRDGTVILKKKCSGGSSNGGTYYNLTSAIRHTVPLNRDASYTATVLNTSDGSVRISLYDEEDALLLSGEDRGVGCSPIISPGRIGVRGDNAEFAFSLDAMPLL